MLKPSAVLLLGVSSFLLPGLTWADPPAPLPPAPQGFDARRDQVERGKVETIEYYSNAVSGKRKATVYTPPGYTKERIYPVLYLLHGAGDDETGWTRKGAADVILDNLSADKKVAPMIVVMPNGFARRPGPGSGPALAAAIMKRADADKDGEVTLDEFRAAAEALFKEIDRGQAGKLDQKQLAEGLSRLVPEPAPTFPRRGAGGTSTFETDLLGDLIPYVEAHYPVRPDAEHRALAGLSMGGGQALTIGLRHLNTFAWVGGFSSALFGRQGDLVPDADARAKLRLLWVSCGDRDSLLEGSKSFHARLEEKQVPHVWHVDAGAHEWPVWKNDLYLLSQMLFQDR
jgi:enterochelin esterase-like enzyme